MAKKFRGSDIGPKTMAKLVAAMGRKGDTQLAHVNPSEVALLEASGGSGGVNPTTGIREFEGGGLQGGRNNGNKIGSAGDRGRSGSGGQGGLGGGVRNQTSGAFGDPEADPTARTSANEGDAVGRKIGATDAQSAALKLAKKQNAEQTPVVNSIATIIGAAVPGPLSLAGSLLKAGMKFSNMAVGALDAEPDKIQTNPNDPGAISGMTKYGLMSNRPRSATPQTAGLGGQPGSQSQGTEAAQIAANEKLKQKQALTILGTGTAPLGTPANPQKI